MFEHLEDGIALGQVFIDRIGAPKGQLLRLTIRLALPAKLQSKYGTARFLMAQVFPEIDLVIFVIGPEWLVRILGCIPHPSGANAARISYSIGRRDKSLPSELMTGD